MSSSIRIAIEPRIFELVPGYRRAVITGREIRNVASASVLQDLLVREQQRIRQELTLDDPRLEEWRAAFRSVGLNPNKFRPSVDAITRRILHGDEIRSISTLVDISTILTLRWLLPCGAHSLDDVIEGLELRTASANEHCILLGESEPRAVPVGEVIYTDTTEVATAKWVWRQTEHTLIRSETRSFALNIDALSGVDEMVLDEIVRDARALIGEFLDVPTEVEILNQKHYEMEVIRG